MRTNLTTFIFLLVLLYSCSDPPAEEVDCSISDLSLEIVEVVSSDCGFDNGRITVKASGGITPYKYKTDYGELQNTPIFINVRAGFREVTVIDKGNCEVTLQTFMSSKDPFEVVFYTTPSGCKQENGTINVVPLGGIPPYKYQLGENNDNYQSTPLWTGLRSGQHSVWVEDANKCFFGVYLTVPTGVSFSSSIATIIETKCASASCHNGSIPPDFRTFSVIKANATKIKNLTANKTMPPGNPLTATEIDLIDCWVSDGAPNN
jgi:hypothetical protein